MPSIFVGCPFHGGVTNRLISARSTAAGQMRSGRQCRPRRAKGPRTRAGALEADADLAPMTSMVAAFRLHFAADYPIGPAGTAEYPRHQHGDAAQPEQL